MAFILGAWNALCQRCAREVKNYELRKEWTGLRVCNRCFETRNPQDHVKGRADRQAPTWVSPDVDGPDVSVGSGNEVRAEDL